MKDLKIGTVNPVAEPRTTQKPGRKEPASGANFNKTLEDALAHLNEATKTSGASAGKMDTSSIKAEITTHQVKFDEVMKAQQMISKLYHNIQSQKPEDRS
jgi:flagellar hook-basal body complex protein FliE